jgi:hypothetical protein
MSISMWNEVRKWLEIGSADATEIDTLVPKDRYPAFIPGTALWCLKCRCCKREEEINHKQGQWYQSHGWPKCCGGVMELKIVLQIEMANNK